MDISRLTEDLDESGVGSDTEGWAVVYSSVACHLQAWSKGEQSNEGAYYYTHLLWCDIDTDIVEGDRVAIASVSYQIYKVEDRNYGNSQHKCVFLVKL